MKRPKNAHLPMKLSLRAWSRELGIDPATLSRRFKAQEKRVPQCGLTLLQLVGNDVIHPVRRPVMDEAMEKYWAAEIARWDERDRRNLRWHITNGFKAMFLSRRLKPAKPE